MKCQKCNQGELVNGTKRIQSDGTEYFELICPYCKERFLDIKLPYSAILNESIDPQPETLIQWLLDSGLNVERDVADMIKDTPETIPFLVDILRTNKYWQKGEAGDAWAPLHALHLLSGMKATEALPVILDILAYKPDDLGDWLTEEMGSILANFGEPAIEPLKKFVADGRNDGYARSAAASALVVIFLREGRKNAALMDWFESYLAHLIEGNDAFVTMFASDLLDLREDRIKEKIHLAFERNVIDGDFFTMEDMDDAYKSDKLPFHDKDPMDHFSRENLNYLMEVNYPELKKRKIGRNEPCPCGSGIKYKKCCMEKDQ